MPTTRNQKKARRSREQEMVFDIENLDIMLGNNLEREESESSDLGRRPESPSYNVLINQNVQSHSISREAEIMSYTQNGHSMRESVSNSEFIRLSG